jgi:hypothetical protein
LEEVTLKKAQEMAIEQAHNLAQKKAEMIANAIVEK